MSDKIALRGVTGPGKTTELIAVDFQEISIRLKKKIIEVVNQDGSTGFYDLARASAVHITSDGDSFMVSVDLKEDENVGVREKDGKPTEGKPAVTYSTPAGATPKK